jgi:hypothetical protein
MIVRRNVLGAVLALTVLSVVTVGAANAQGGGGGGGRRGGMMGGMMGRGGLGMLRIPEVQKELKMTPDQIAKVDTKQQEMRSAFQAGQGGGQGGDPEERQKRMAEMQAMQTKAVTDILNADQQKRYHQLELQQQGTMALASRKDIQDELKLTDDQKTKIDDIRQKAMDDMRSSMQGVDFQSMTAEERQQMMTKMREAQKSTSDKIEAILTDDQKKQWKDMQGTPFKFPPMQPGRGGPGGGRRGNPAT